MELIPAIDVLAGQVVRLTQGDFDRVTVYSDDPVRTAERWCSEGATRLHLVDLDGARTGRPVQGDLLARIAAAVPVPCQVGGGLRDEAAVATALSLGADRVVLGTAILRDRDLPRRLVADHGSDRIVGAIDVRDGRALGFGWVAGDAGLPIDEALARVADAGITWLAVTAVARDGRQTGPDLGLLERVAAAMPGARIIASAGISRVEHVRALALRGMAGAILGRALYEGTLSLAEALAAALPAAP